MTRSKYRWEVHERPGVGLVVAIVDLHAGAGRTVTNDADAVIDDFRRSGVDVRAHRFIYRDTTGTWDELVVTDTGVTFAPLRERDLECALTKLAARVDA